MFIHESGKTIHSLPAAFQETAARRGDTIALRTVGGVVELTWTNYRDRVARIAEGLAALGVSRTDTVAIMLTNRPEFHLVDTAALHLGAAPFSIYNTSAPEQIAYLFSNAGNRVVVTELALIDKIRAAGGDIDHIICVDGQATGALTLDDLEQRTQPGFDFKATWNAVEPSDLATIIYTSGTTGPPKGVELTHANVLAQLIGLESRFSTTPEDRIPSYLPAAHIADRVTAHYPSLTRGQQITSVSDPRELAAALPDVRPTVFFGVPRVWQKMKVAIETTLADESSPVKRRLAGWALETGLRAARADMAGQPRGGTLRLTYPIADALVLSKVRHALGMENVRAAVSGAAPIPAEILEFFFGLGISIAEVWGMSETSGVTTMTSFESPRVGTVGTPIAGVEVRLADDGEIFTRGPIIMRGYRGQPDKTAECLDADGWLASGDIATVDRDGNYTIVDRKKELLITQSGKNIAPANIENALKATTSLIGQAVAIGEARAYVTALIVLDPDAAVGRAKAFGIPDADLATLGAHPDIRAELLVAVHTANQKLNRVEQVKRFTIIPATWDPSGDELSHKGSLKRTPIAVKYADEINAMYAENPSPTVIDVG